MLGQLKQKRFLIIFGLAVFAILLVVGYFSASFRSEPVYLTKIDKIMYDKKNRSPKYIMTMPEKAKVKAKAEEVTNVMPEENEEKINDIASIMKSIPFLASLGDIGNKTPLKCIDVVEECVKAENNLSIPTISKDGKKAWQVYSRESSIQPNFYKIAVVIKSMGLNEIETNLISQGLPPEVSFSFSPYTTTSEAQIKKARSQGHETYVDLLLSSKDFLKSDTGPLAMSVTNRIEENIERVKKTLSVKAPVGGMLINSGQSGDDSRERIKKILENLKDMGLLVLDATGEDNIDKIEISGLARKKADILIDKDFSKESIAKQLLKAEQIALNNGQVLVVLEPKPVAVIAINDWIKTFSPQLSYEQMRQQNITSIKRPFALVPVSSIVVE